MSTNKDRCGSIVSEPTSEDLALGRLMALWQHGEAARYDPVLLNMQARIAAELRRVSMPARVRVFVDFIAAHLSLKRRLLAECRVYAVVCVTAHGASQPIATAMAYR